MSRYSDAVTPPANQPPNFEHSTHTFTNVAIFLLIAGVAVFAGVNHLERERAEALRAQRLIQFHTALSHLNESHSALARHLLSGETDLLQELSQQEREGIVELEQLASTSKSRTEWEAVQHLINYQHDWHENFAQILIKGRSAVDSGKSTVAALQITYLQLDPTRWSREFDNLSSSAFREFNDAGAK